MSAAHLIINEVTLGFPNIYDQGKTELTLWGPETTTAMHGATEWMRDPNAYHNILALMIETGMHWEEGPYRAAELAHTFEMEEWEEHGSAYEKWCLEEVNMDDLHEPSLFTEWNQGQGCSTYVGADQMSKNMKVSEFTPEMLLQRDNLNYFYNFVWNKPTHPGCPRTRFSEMNSVPNNIELLTLAAVGDNHGVAKCDFGAVFVPRGAIQHLKHNGGATVGTIFDGEITFTPQNKFPWRLEKNGITFTYEDMCGTRNDIVGGRSHRFEDY